MRASSLLLIIVAVVLACGFSYAFLRGNGDRGTRPGRGASQARRRAGTQPSSMVAASRDSSGQQTDDVTSAVPDGTDRNSLTLQEWMRNGIALTMTGDVIPQEEALPLLKIDDVSDEVRQGVLSHIASLRNFDTVHQLQRMMGDPRTTMTDLSRMIIGNPLVSAKILQVANSAYYGMEQKLNSISHAIMIIGVASLKAIVYQEGLLQVLKEKSFADKPAMQTMWQHASYTSIYSSYLHCLFGGLNMGTLFTLGLLHDIGKFIMMRLKPLHQNEGDPPIDYSPAWTMAEEEKIYGIDHALVGRLALQHWGLSRLIVETVTLHHAPVHLPPDDLGMDRETLQCLLVLLLADQAARLFAGIGSEVRVERLHPSYHCLIDRNKLSQVIVDKSLMSQLREAEAITSAYT